MNNYEIQKNIPMPPKSSNKPRYPFRELQVGDSFLMDSDLTRFPTMASAAYQSARRLGVKFSLRRTPEGVRCWRVG